MNRQKCRFGCSDVKYVGHILTSEGISTNPEKVSAIASMAPPRNTKHLLTSLQTCNWYRRFIDKFSEVARPLTNLTKKNVVWEWGPTQSAAFEELKTALTSAPILKPAELGKPYILRTDSSAYALGAALLQGEGNEERPVEYASRLLSPPERNYSTTEREALALVWAVQKFRGYLEEAPFIAITDHQPLRWLMSLKSPSGRLARWALQLQPYNLKIEYTPGKANILADTLSRPPCDQDTTIDCPLCIVSIELPRTGAKELRQDQLSDPDLKKIIDSLEQNNQEESTRWAARGYMMSQGVLHRYSSDDDTENPQYVVPLNKREAIIRDHHDAPSAGHYGAERTYYKIIQRFYWTGMRKMIQEYVKNCEMCQRYKISNQKPAGLLQTPVMRQQFESISIDLFGPLPKGPDGETWIFIVEDCASRWIELFALKDAKAETCAWVLVQEICLRYGLPRRIISDNGTQFISAAMQKICYCFDMDQVFTPVYHPAANMVERKNRDLKTQISILVGNEHQTWPEKLASIRFAMNTTRCQSTGFSPAYLTFGQEPRTPSDVKHDLRAVILSENFIPEVTPRLVRIVDTLKEAREKHEAEQDRQKHYADQHRRPGPQIQPCDRVLVKTHPVSNSAKGRTSKFAPKRDGPYIVLNAKGPCSFEIAAPDHPSLPLGVYHVSDLRLVTTQDEDPQPILPIRRRGRPRKQPPRHQNPAGTSRGSEGGDL
ncbi:hypothetical protein Zmor_023352 [Zophobas morio]|uniref:RNA-directed DNA polymerase n=1 Tax=Zophobas morio TaxID=2755281 RepID=A0AA38M7A2_9CUCU|nr:hypothetical protein Zmor_023352 [Zophobas morio]